MQIIPLNLPVRVYLQFTNKVEKDAESQRNYTLFISSSFSLISRIEIVHVFKLPEAIDLVSSLT